MTNPCEIEGNRYSIINIIFLILMLYAVGVIINYSTYPRIVAT